MAPALFIGHKKEIQSGSGLLLKIKTGVGGWGYFKNELLCVDSF